MEPSDAAPAPAKEFYKKSITPKRRPTASRSKEPIVISDDSEPGVLAGVDSEEELKPYIPPERAENGSFRTYRITEQDLQCLVHRRCLNDAVVNAYMAQLSNDYNVKGNIGFTNSFWINKLRRDGCEAAANWEGIWGKRLDTYSKFLIPVATHAHWILFEIRFSDSVINIYDSVGRKGAELARNIRQFMESQGITNKFVTKWPPVPKQSGCRDCGVFLLQYAACIFENIPIDRDTFSQQHVKGIRSKILAELTSNII